MTRNENGKRRAVYTGYSPRESTNYNELQETKGYKRRGIT